MLEPVRISIFIKTCDRIAMIMIKGVFIVVLLNRQRQLNCYFTDVKLIQIVLISSVTLYKRNIVYFPFRVLA